MNSLTLRVREPYFSMIRSGKKKIEGRIAKPKFYFKKNDRVLIQSDSAEEKFFVSIERVKHYKSFKEMLHAEGIGNVLPCCRNLSEALEIYHSFLDYKVFEKKLGVLALHLAPTAKFLISIQT
jgi:ASC-1-like (ASCH) protein